MDNANSPVRYSTLPETVNDIENREKELQEELDRVRSEKERLQRELESRDNNHQKNSLPTREEIESISAMLDLVNKLDENMINKIQKLSRTNIRNADNS